MCAFASKLINTHTHTHTLSTGNGPAGIALSLMLSGHWPYFTGVHPDPYLTQKLAERPQDSLLEQVSCLYYDVVPGRGVWLARPSLLPQVGSKEGLACQTREHRDFLITTILLTPPPPTPCTDFLAIV